MDTSDHHGPSTQAGVWIVAPDALPALEDQPGQRVFVLETPDVLDRSGFFSAVRDQLPQDPPLGSFRDVWDAMSDSLFGGFFEVDAEIITLVWKGAHALRDHARADYDIAVDVLRQVVEQLADARYTDGRPTVVRVFVERA